MDTRQLRVADVMTIDPIVVADDAPLEDVYHLLHTYSISGLPVIDRNGALVGVISQSDLIAIEDAPLGRLIRKAATGIRVGELMSSPAITIFMTSSLGEATRVMRDRRVHRLVALDDAGRPVGVLSAFDLIALFAEV